MISLHLLLFSVCKYYMPSPPVFLLNFIRIIWIREVFSGQSKLRAENKRALLTIFKRMKVLEGSTIEIESRIRFPLDTGISTKTKVESYSCLSFLMTVLAPVNGNATHFSSSTDVNIISFRISVHLMHQNSIFLHSQTVPCSQKIYGRKCSSA